jgi:site-specific DNA recombinase
VSTRRSQKLIQALKDGVPASLVKDEIVGLERQQNDLRDRLARATEPPPLLHPNMSDLSFAKTKTGPMVLQPDAP